MNIFPPFVSPLECFSKLKKNLNNRLVLVPQTVHIMHHMERSGGLGQGPWSADTESQSPSWCVWCKHWWKGIHGRLFNMHIHWEDILALNRQCIPFAFSLLPPLFFTYACIYNMHIFYMSYLQLWHQWQCHHFVRLHIKMLWKEDAEGLGFPGRNIMRVMHGKYTLCCLQNRHK